MSEIPLEPFFNDAVVLDFSQRNSCLEISKEEIEKKLKEIGYLLKKDDIVLLRTGGEKYWGSSDYTSKYVGLSVEGLDFLLDLGVQVIGTDGFGLDQPFQWMHDNYIESKDKSYLWPVHIHGRKRPYYMIEKLGNLQSLDNPFGFKVAAFPVKVKKASAGLAIIEEN
ncbi:cyclase family protein [Ruminiclostridium josui]|uniref:cyclase family protein n=1 Tax=Ruminiclostridium josui TaxID=1499 RepID=UPI001FA6F374|nr:cyclase family protein [Ruminiclostridium josui]